jgi:putative SOS response-associated peptidase YedK
MAADRCQDETAFAFRLKDDAPLAFAGLWDAWRDPTGAWLQSFSIVTTEANELMSTVHTRMPVILHPRDYGRWLERDSERPPVDLLRPFESEAMAAQPCNPLVGNVKNNGPEMLNSA